MKHMSNTQRIWTIIGIVCGLALFGFLLFSIFQGSPVFSVGASGGAVPDSAVTGSAMAIGRNGPITVEVVADSDRIYQIRVPSEGETPDIGGVAITKLAKEIISGQTLDVDSVSGATITSEALKTAIGSALQQTGVDTKQFGVRLV